MLKIKGCPRCRGDVLLDRDHHGWYEQCLQCSYLRDLKGIVEIRRQQVEAEKGTAREN